MISTSIKIWFAHISDRHKKCADNREHTAAPTVTEPLDADEQNLPDVLHIPEVHAELDVGDEVIIDNQVLEQFSTYEKAVQVEKGPIWVVAARQTP